MPKVSPQYLDRGFAQEATDCDFDSGQLRGAHGPEDTGIGVQTNTGTLYWYNREGNGGDGFWLQWNEDVDVVRSPIADDDEKRLYWTGDGVPRFGGVSQIQNGAGPYPGASYELGLPVPEAPTASGASSDPPDGVQEEETAYVMTFVDVFGAEGPPSPPSNTVTRWDGFTVSLTNMEVPSGNFNVTLRRLYRLTLAGVYQYVGETAIGNNTLADDVDNAELGEPVPSDGWIAPNPDMVGLTALPGGVLMGWWENTLAFSEPYQPHAWPTLYRETLDFEIVGAAVSSQGVVVATTGKPYMVVGTGPGSYSIVKLDHTLSCVSKRSVVDMGDYVVYASPDGLVAVGGQTPEIVTKNHITPQQWRTRYLPSTIRAVRWDNKYLAFYDLDKAFAFGEEGFQDYSDGGFALWHDHETGDVYFRVSTSLYRWSEGNRIAYEWTSKEFTLPPLERYGVCQVDAESYPVTLEFYRDGTLAKTQTVQSRGSFRLPTTSQYRRCSVRVTGDNPVNFIQLATNKSEIA